MPWRSRKLRLRTRRSNLELHRGAVRRPRLPSEPRRNLPGRAFERRRHVFLLDAAMVNVAEVFHQAEVGAESRNPLAARVRVTVLATPKNVRAHAVVAGRDMVEHDQIEPAVLVEVRYGQRAG